MASLLLGIIEGVSDGASSFAKLYSGLYSDRLRRRKGLAVAGYFLTASGLASFGGAAAGVGAWWRVRPSAAERSGEDGRLFAMDTDDIALPG